MSLTHFACKFCGYPLDYLLKCTNAETDCNQRCKRCGLIDCVCVSDPVESQSSED